MKIEDPFFIDSKIEKSNIIINQQKFNFEKIILSNNYQIKKYEGESNNYCKIIKMNNNYNLYYRASNNPYLINNKFNNNYDYNQENLCIAQSKDGLYFEKTKLTKNNIIKKQDFCHNFFPNFINNHYIALSGTKLNNDGLFLFDSTDGYKWKNQKKILDSNNILQYYKHKNHFDTHNSIIYNNQNKFYYIHIRHNHCDDTRKVQCIKSYDLKTLLDPELISINHEYNYEIYNLNVDKLNNYDYFISIPNYAKSKNIKNQENKDFMVKHKFVNDILISKDGINFETFLSNIELSNISTNSQVCPVHGFIPSPNQKKLYFYFQNNVHQENHEVQCYSLSYNRFNEYKAIKYGYIKTQLLNIKNYNIEINFKTDKKIKQSYIIVELLDINNNRIKISKITKGNLFNKKVEWFEYPDSPQTSTINQCYIKFHLINASIYSYSYIKKNSINLDFIWSKGIYTRDSYSLLSTNCQSDERNIVQLLDSNKKVLWIRNNATNQKNKLRDLDYLAKHISKIKENKIIVLGDGDDPIPSSYNKETFEKILTNKFIKKIFIQNYDNSIKHRKLAHYPIGLDLHSPKYLLDFNYQQKINYYLETRNSSISYINNKIYCDSHLSNSHPSRKEMYEKIKKNQYIDFQSEKLNFKEIIKKYRSYRFVLSPRGNGLDCHRTWELFLLGCIVITTTSSLDTMWKENNLPVVILKDYNELNDTHLNLRLEFWLKKYKDYTQLENIIPKFKNSYWLNKYSI